MPLYPNVLRMSAPAFNACKNNPNVVGRFQYNGQVGIDATQITPIMLAGLFNMVKVVVGAEVYWNDANAAVDICVGISSRPSPARKSAQRSEGTEIPHAGVHQFQFTQRSQANQGLQAGELNAG